MEVLLHYAVLIVSAIWLTRRINRIAVACETSAIHLAALFKTLSPEAQARANAAIDHEFEAIRPKSSNTRRVDVTSTF
jgi:hypothetical protein